MVSDIFLTTSDGFHFKWPIKLQLTTDFKLMQIETSEIQMRVKGGFVNLHLNPQQFSRFNGLFAESSHMVWNKLCWDSSYTVGTFITKESRAGLVRVPLLWSPTV